MSTSEVETKSKLDAFDLSNLVGDSGPLRMVIHATLHPVAGLDRFQPAGFPEIGHVIYPAPRKASVIEHVCIVDSAASMANHLEAVCRGAPHDPDAVSHLAGMPYLRCVTDAGWPEHDEKENKSKPKQLVVTSLTEGHRIASTYFLGERVKGKEGKPDTIRGQRITGARIANETFGEQLARECGVLAGLGKKAHAPPEAWWTVFSTIFKYDPNALVHGVLFPQWNIKISRLLTAHLEALGAARVDRSGVKFDRLGKTTSGQPIFAVDDATAREIRATFIIDVALLRSFGRDNRGLSNEQKQFLLALALWKIGRLVGGAFRYRSGCDLECADAIWDGQSVKDALTMTDITTAIRAAAFRAGDTSEQPIRTDIYWPADELYRQGDDGKVDVNSNSADEDSKGDGDDEAESEE